jgi:hypothetical protein
MNCSFKLPFLEGGLEEDPDQPNTVPYPDSGDLNEQNELTAKAVETHTLETGKLRFDKTFIFSKLSGVGSQKT